MVANQIQSVNTFCNILLCSAYAESVDVKMFYGIIIAELIQSKQKGESTMIGEKIRTTRLEKGMSQEELAELARLHRVSVAKYETNRVEPGADALSRIADVLEVSADYLLDKTGDSSIPAERSAAQLQKRIMADPALKELLSVGVLATVAEKKAAVAMLKSLRASRSATSTADDAQKA